MHDRNVMNFNAMIGGYMFLPFGAETAEPDAHILAANLRPAIATFATVAGESVMVCPAFHKAGAGPTVQCGVTVPDGDL
ncbi:hypothetical protein AB838_03540 [Rhodobacteraceae bacterium (ex Bugula neritina AB1)]|nr:hypothetical protein AB838_03540 [Rhodobacteraceae bacterium (ex Bugula neritina AB1)]